MAYAVFDPITNSFALTGTIPEGADPEGPPPEEGVDYWSVPEGTDPEMIYVHEGELKVMPPQPAPYLTFNFGTEQWEDQRTQQEYDDYVLAVRGSAEVTKYKFLSELVQGAAFNYEDIVDLAVGYFPQSILAALSGWSQAQTLDAQLAWVSSTTVRRLDPLIVAVETHMGTDPTDTDQLFGVSLYPPPS